VTAAWTQEELRLIAGEDELHIAAEKPDGTLRAARPIWAVRVGDDVYVRAAYGSKSAWYRVARQTGRAEISVAGLAKQVTAEAAVEDTDAGLLEMIDHAYLEKYARRYASIVDSINDEEPRASTLRLLPREGS
jgi:hypothetical protein